MVQVRRMLKPDPALVQHLFERAGMESEGANPRFFADTGNILLVAFADTAACGFLWAYVLEGPHQDRPKLFLYSIDVFPEFRRQGVGIALIAELKAIAWERRCSEAFVFTEDSNVPAKALYERAGGVRENPDDVMYVFPL